MNKVQVTIHDNCIIFEKCNQDIPEKDLNNTNVIDTKKLKFTEQYIEENFELIITFLSLIALKFKITKSIIKNLEISEIAVKIINNLNSIKYICFSENDIISYTVSSLLLTNKNLKQIECYNIPEIMFYAFDCGILKTRNKVLSTSKFFDYNNIKTTSDIYNKREILISHLFNDSDISDLKYFFSTNKSLKKIRFNPYNRINLETILKLLKKNNLRKIKIVIYEDNGSTNKILGDIKLFEKFSKQYEVDIRVKYSTLYRDNNSIKELNIKLLKYILVTSVIICLFIFFSSEFIKKRDSKAIKDSIAQINKIIKKNEMEDYDSEQETKENSEKLNSNNYVSSYYQSYSDVYNDLLSFNSDTVGWLTVNNTKINYPVVQSEDNEYYLNRAYDKTINSAGWVFVDYRNDLDKLDQNTIIYGHSMVNDGLIFSTLKNTLNENWYADSNNLIINFSIKGVEHKWQVFSIYSTETTSDYLNINYDDVILFENFINTIKSRSVYNFNVDIDDTDKILTLSTCYIDGNHRVVLHAKKIY